MAGACAHIDLVRSVLHPKARVCEECVRIKASWLHHARAMPHPVIASAEPGERWLYCYPDDAFAEY